MFPQLVAGPIIRAKDMLAQLTQSRTVGWPTIWNGLRLVAIGLFQKTVLADNIGALVNHAFANEISNVASVQWWIVIIAFAFQIYFDFSGYSLIARGLAKLMGYHFRMNFNHPYLASSLKDFWRRWHISLSSWFRDYVYIPLGGNKKGRVYGHFFMWTTMLISGLWHGAELTFVFWGLIHAVILTLERLTSKMIKVRFINYIITMFFVLIAWVYFRATSIGQGNMILAQMFSFDAGEFYLKEFYGALIFLGLAIIFEIFYHLKSNSLVLKKYYRSTVVESLELASMIVGVFFFRGEDLDFIYFQF